METINIIITGFPNAGKSTITNSFTGTNYSKVNTQKITDFSMGMFDKYTSAESINQLIDERQPVVLPYPVNCQLAHDWNYSIHDLVGVSTDNNKVKIGSRNISYTKKSKKETDILIVVFDINKFEEDMTKNLELLKIVSENASNPHKIIVVLNKCDNVVVTEQNTTFSDKEDHIKFKRYEEFLKLNNYDEVFPLCAKNSSRISAGDNNALTDEYEKECYINERLHSDSTTLLTRSGFNKIVSSINNFLTGNKNQLINKHVLLELFNSDEEHNLKSITSLLNRMQKTNTGEEQHVANGLKEMILTHLTSMNGDQSGIDLNGDLESTKKELNELSQKYSDIFNAQLDTENSFETMLEKIETKHLLRQLEHGWYPDVMIKLFNKNMLTRDLFAKSVSKHINEDNILNVIHGISLMTNHNPEYIYDVLNVFVQKYKMYIAPFKYGNITDPVFDYIRLTLLDTNSNQFEEIAFANFGVNFTQYKKAKKMFESLNKLFTELNEKNNEDSFEENQNFTDSSDMNSKESKHDEIIDVNLPLNENVSNKTSIFEKCAKEPIVTQHNKKKKGKGK